MRTLVISLGFTFCFGLSAMTQTCVVLLELFGSTDDTFAIAVKAPEVSKFIPFEFKKPEQRLVQIENRGNSLPKGERDPLVEANFGLVRLTEKSRGRRITNNEKKAVRLNEHGTLFVHFDPARSNEVWLHLVPVADPGNPIQVRMDLQTYLSKKYALLAEPFEVPLLPPESVEGALSRFRMSLTGEAFSYPAKSKILAWNYAETPEAYAARKTAPKLSWELQPGVHAPVRMSMAQMLEKANYPKGLEESFETLIESLGYASLAETPPRFWTRVALPSEAAVKEANLETVKYGLKERSREEMRQLEFFMEISIPPGVTQVYHFRWGEPC